MKEYLKSQKIGRIIKRTIKNPLVGILLTCAGCGFVVGAGGTLFGYYMSRPVSIQSANLNGDNKPDLVIKYGGGKIEERVQMPDGNYKLFSQEEKEEAKREAKMQAYLENNIPFSSDDL